MIRRPRGNKLKINVGGTAEMRMRHWEEWSGGVQRASQGANTGAQGELSPSCLSAPPYTLFMEYK